MLRMEDLSGSALIARLDDLARLRIEVFRAWPYLYEGDVEYERGYLRRYAEAKTGYIAVAYDGDRAVGAATALALEEEADFVRAPFIEAGMDIAPIYYFGESVLLPGYRGQGVGVDFFRRREAAARRNGKTICCFCGVQRPADHPARPADYVPLDAFWRKRGYHQRPDLRAGFSWKDIGDDTATEKPMIYWMRELPA
ncbi:GNAT family N-acetyltransferase [Ferrovibrio sp.]|uniref:GNAT family N-acetyltransferase n=1 Tax=Ferrovibrio sp. TaxID=1917215 RepID=UPI0025BE007D|nr:GNAT family N-acetyltransferase [Ferrovibrio sp.]MBX3453449.1 GNAT family N-acetyltransferase [Ferrovibrio sp.]